MSGLIQYPFQLSPNRWAHLQLPSDLSKRDVQRLSNFLTALVVDAVATPVEGSPSDPSRKGNE